MVRQQSKGDGAPIYTIGECSFSHRGGKGSIDFVKNTGQDSVIGWRNKWFYVKDTPVDGQEFNLAPFVDGKAVPLSSWSNPLTKEEKAEVKKLLPSIKEAVDHLQKNYGFTRLISTFMKLRIQLLQVRPSTMWEYSGPQDASRMKRKDFAKEAPEEAVHSVIKGAKAEKLPSDCSVDPYGGGIGLPEVRSSTSIYSFSPIFSVPSSSTSLFSYYFSGSSQVREFYSYSRKPQVSGDS